MTTIVKFACDFQFDMPTLDIGDWEVYGGSLVLGTDWLQHTIEFHSDIWEFFCERDEPLQLEIGFRYHVFIYGTIEMDFGIDSESGRDELDGLYAEFSEVIINKIGEIPESEFGL